MLWCDDVVQNDHVRGSTLHGMLRFLGLPRRSGGIWRSRGGSARDLKCIVNNSKNASDERFASKRKLYTAICLRLADQNARPRPPHGMNGVKRNLVAADNRPPGYAAIWGLKTGIRQWESRLATLVFLGFA